MEISASDTCTSNCSSSSYSDHAAATVWLVTGANRGMGFAYVSQILSRPQTQVVAAARPADDCSELQALLTSHKNRMMIVPLELSDPGSVLVCFPKQSKVNCLHPKAEMAVKSLTWTLEDFKNVLLINVLGTFSVTKAFLPLLKCGRQKTIVHISSIAASLSNNKSFVHQEFPSEASLGLSYRASKVAINMETTVLANDLKCDGFTVVSVHPGDVSTVMYQYLADNVFNGSLRSSSGHTKPHFTPQQSVQVMLHLILGLTPEDTGKFLLYDGTEVPW